jgi:hypothetical protein
LVAKAVIEMLVETTEGTARLFKFLATIVRHSCVKVSVLSVLSGKLADLMAQQLTTVDESSEHVAGQFHILTLLHSLLDCEISMLSHLASGLPSKELITQLGGAIVENFCKSSAENVTYAAVRAMILLADHDVTFAVLKASLTANAEIFVDRLNAIAEKCKNERKQMALIPDLLELFRALLSAENSGEITSIPPRTTSMTVGELSSLFKWNSEEFKNGSKIHFLEVFSALVNEPAVEDEEVFPAETIKSDLEALLEQIREAKVDEKVATDVESPLAQAEGIVTQFSSRVAFYTTENLDELTMDYWILNGCDEEETPEVVQCDLDELVRQCLPVDTNIGSDCKRLMTLSSSPQSSRERNQAGLCFRTRRVEVVDPIAGRPEKKIFGKCE